jgi:hypothetical protein
MSEFKFPTEVIDLPSKGLIYPESSPLSSGTIELKYMSAKEEDILTNQNFIQKGIVIDKLLQSMIVDKKIDYNELILGDKNAILVAARILGYGAEYEVEITDKYGKKIPTKINLSQLENKSIKEELFTKGKNSFDFILPQSKVNVTFKLLNHKDEMEIEKEIQGLKKAFPNESFDITTRLKHQIISINGDSSVEKVRYFVDNMLLTDSRALRKYIAEIMPDLDMTFSYEDSKGDIVEGVSIPMNINFLWPDASL